MVQDSSTSAEEGTGLSAGRRGQRRQVGRQQEGQRQGDLPPVRHEAWEAETVRGMNEVLSAELQPEVQLLEAVEAPWKEEGEAGGGEVVKVRKVKTAGASKADEEGEGAEEAPGESADTAGAAAPEEDEGGM